MQLCEWEGCRKKGLQLGDGGEVISRWLFYYFIFFRFQSPTIMQFERSHVSPGVCSQVKLPLFAAAARNVSLQQGIVMDRGTSCWGGGGLKCQICKGEKGKMHNGACADARPTGGASLHRCRGFYCSPCFVANYSEMKLQLQPHETRRSD